MSKDTSLWAYIHFSVTLSTADLDLLIRKQMLCEQALLIHFCVTLSTADLDLPFSMQLLSERASLIHSGVTLSTADLDLPPNMQMLCEQVLLCLYTLVLHSGTEIWICYPVCGCFMGELCSYILVLFSGTALLIRISHLVCSCFLSELHLYNLNSTSLSTPDMVNFTFIRQLLCELNSEKNMGSTQVDWSTMIFLACAVNPPIAITQLWIFNAELLWFNHRNHRT